MLKRVICAVFALSLVLSGCGSTEEEEYVFSLSKEQQENYAEMIENELNSFYWYYDDSSLAYYEAKVPENSEEHAQMFEASRSSGYDMEKYAGREAVVYTADLNHINSQKAGIVYFYFVRNNIAGLFYSPSVNPGKYEGLNMRNVFTPSAGFEKTESDAQYGDEHSGRKISTLQEGFSSEYRTDNGSYLLEITESSVNIYRYSNRSLKRYKVISSASLGGLTPISASFMPDGRVAVMAGTTVTSYEGAENERVLSEKVLFFDSGFSKEQTEIELESGSYSCVAYAGDYLVLVNDKYIELYSYTEGGYKKSASFYANIQAVDFKEADIDNDGVKEYIVTDGKDLCMYRISDRGLKCIWRTNVSASCYYGYIYTGDLNGDGTDEIYISDSTGTAIRYVLGKDGLVTRNDDISYGQRIYAGDFDNNGSDDYIFYDGESCTIYMRE